MSARKLIVTAGFCLAVALSITGCESDYSSSDGVARDEAARSLSPGARRSDVATLFSGADGIENREAAATDRTAAGKKLLRRALHGIFVRASDAMLRANDELRAGGNGCGAGAWNSCRTGQWRAFVAGLAGRDRMVQMRALNLYVNRARYASDMRNYGVDDFWATPSQLFERGGDCEDYVVAKYAALRVLGVAADDMRISVARDLRRAKTHAVLMVTVEGREYMMDSQNPLVLPASEVRHYRPLYSLANLDRQLYAAPRGTPNPLAAANLTAPSSLPAAAHFVQVGAHRTRSSGEKSWARLKALHPRLLGAESHVIARRDFGAPKGTYFRVRLGPFADRRAANAKCAELQSARIDCFAVRAALKRTARSAAAMPSPQPSPAAARQGA